MQFLVGIGMVVVFATVNLSPNPIAVWKVDNDRVPQIHKELAAVAQTPPSSGELLQQGREFFQAQQFSQAVTVWQQAVTDFNNEGDRLNQGLGLNYLSLAYQKLGQWPEATSAIASCLSLLPTRDNNHLGLEELSILGQALNTQGHLKYATGESAAALTLWEEAEAIYAQMNDTEGAIGSKINQAQALQALGLYRRSRKTLEVLELSLRNEPDSLIKATGLRSLGNTLRAIGDLDKSREVLQQSLNISQNLDLPLEIAAAQLSLGNTARAIAKNALALQDKRTANTELKNALDAYEQAAEISPSGIIGVRSQLNQISLLIDTPKFNDAKPLLPSIQQQLEGLPISRQSIHARINFAHSLMGLLFDRDSLLVTQSGETVNQQSSIYLIANQLAKAVQEAKTLKDPRSESYALGGLGRLYELTKQFPEAQTLTEKALSIAQSINASEIAYHWHWQLGRVLKEQGKKNETIAAHQFAIKILQTLRKDLVAMNTDNPDIQFSFRESVEPVYRQLVDLLTSPDEEPREENLRQARQAIESLQLAALDNFFKEACLEAKPVQIDKVDSTAAVIYPIILPDRLAVILSLPNAPLQLYNTIQSKSVIKSLLQELRQEIGRRSGNSQRVLEISEELYNLLIKPAESELKNSQVETLVFVLDGLLRHIPMAILYDGEQYLIEKYSIALTPGLQLLPPEPLNRGNLQLLTVGLSAARHGFSALPNVETEIQKIDSQVPSQILLNHSFTKAKLQEKIDSIPFPIVHIATHAQFSSHAKNTFILSWDSKINVKELDELLRKQEEKSSTPIELLVLSACETAAGDDRAALGLAGVAIGAGARSTLATLWKISDDSTAQLMVRFYQELTQDSHVSKAEALRRAQLSLLKENRYKFPYFWSPYILVGNWQ